MQCFLDRWFKRKYTSKPVSVYDFLERQDRKIFRNVSYTEGYPLSPIKPCVEPSSYNPRKETCVRAKIKTMRFKNSFISCLSFKYELLFAFLHFLLDFKFLTLTCNKRYVF